MTSIVTQSDLYERVESESDKWRSKLIYYFFFITFF